MIIKHYASHHQNFRVLHFTFPIIFSFPLNFSAEMSYSNYDFNDFDEFEPFEQDAPREHEENENDHEESEEENSLQSRRTSPTWKYFNEQTSQHPGCPLSSLLQMSICFWKEYWNFNSKDRKCQKQRKKSKYFEF